MQKFGLTAGSAFIPVTVDADCDLVDLVVKGYIGECQGGVSIQTLNEYGQTLKTYAWQDYKVIRKEVVVAEFYGWYDTDDNSEVKRGDVPFQAGEGLWTYSTADGYTIQSSGQVPQSKVVVELQKFGLSIANPTPVTVDLTKCIVGGYEGECQGGVSVQTLNEYGQTLKTYAWQDYKVIRKEVVVAEFHGWYDTDDNSELLEGLVPVDPGIGLWTYSTADGYTFEWPGVEIK